MKLYEILSVYMIVIYLADGSSLNAFRTELRSQVVAF